MILTNIWFIVRLVLESKQTKGCNEMCEKNIVGKIVQLNSEGHTLKPIKDSNNSEIFAEKKARALMIVIEKIIALHNNGECNLDEEIFKLFKMAKSIKWAKNNKELVDAMNIET